MPFWPPLKTFYVVIFFLTAEYYCVEGYFGIQKRLFLPLQTPNGLRLITLMAMASKMRSFYCTAM